MIFRLLLFAAVILSASPVGALTMDEAVTIALEKNHHIKDLRHQTEAQRERVQSEKAAFFPELTLSYSVDRKDNVFFFETKTASTFTAEATYNLFNGFSDLNTMKSTESLLDASLYQQKAGEADLILQVKRSYIAVLRAGKDQKVNSEAVSLLERQRKDVELFYREGIVAKNELLKVDVELASAQQELLQSESSLRIARQTLERTTGSTLDEVEVINEIELEEYGVFKHETLMAELLRRRSELRYLRARMKARQFDRDSVRGGYFPSVDLTVSHERFGESVVPDGRDEGLTDTETKAMVMATWSIFDGFKKKYDIGAEEREIRAIDERISDTEHEMKLQLSSALEKFTVAQGKLGVAERSIDHAQENYRITNNQFRERIATTTDLIDARVFLTRAQTQYYNALYDMHEAVAEIARVVERRLENGDPFD